jgi:hypothetical protein
VLVLRAFLVQESEGKTPALARSVAPDARQAGAYLTRAAAARLQAALRAPRRAGGRRGHAAAGVRRGAGERASELRTFALSLGDDFRISEPNTALIYVIGTVGPWLLVLVIVWFVILRQMRSPGGAGGVLSFGRSRASPLRQGEPHQHHLRRRRRHGGGEGGGAREIIEFLKNPRQVRSAWAARSRAACCWSARPAPARRCWPRRSPARPSVPFFSISGSDFVEMFVGVGASRVRDLFEQAKQNAPVHHLHRRDRRRRPSPRRRPGRRPRRARADAEPAPRRDGRLRRQRAASS